jgi:extracellular elastinolytic metalloproteinase
VNPFTGQTESLRSMNAQATFGLPPGQRPTDQMLMARALEHGREVAPALGFDALERVEFVPDPHIKETSTGGRVVTLQQQYHGIPVFQMERTVWFDKDGVVQNVTGTSVGLPDGLETLPTVTLQDAAVVVAKYIAAPNGRTDAWTKAPIAEPTLDVSHYIPQSLGTVAVPSQPTVLEKGPFGENIPAHLVMFYQGPTTRLGWHMVISTPGFDAQYVVIAEADSQAVDPKNPQVLYCQKTSSDMRTVRGNVWTHNPGMNRQRMMVDFPRPIKDYPIDPAPENLPAGFPPPWITEHDDQSRGNNTIAVLGTSQNSLKGRLDAEGNALIFDPARDDGDEQKVLNIFYFCNFMHDFFYMLGFDEAHGNFQQSNPSGIGRSGDPILARAHAGPVTGTANMLTLADGKQGLMNMGLVAGGINRHTAFDSDVVFHEFTHGVSNRLVGGLLDARGLQQPQSVGMGEGWSDYFALTIPNYSLDPERTVTGDWVTKRSEGIRLAPYDEHYPASFGHLGKPPYDEDEHAVGEIWCATLMQMNRNFGAALGDKKKGHLLGWQIVVDGLKLTPANPSFLDARDAILHALDAKQQDGTLSTVDYKKVRKAAWEAFAKFGMGPHARSVGASLFGVVEDKSLPADL